MLSAYHCNAYAIFNHGHTVTAWYCSKNGEDRRSVASSLLTKKDLNKDVNIILF